MINDDRFVSNQKLRIFLAFFLCLRVVLAQTPHQGAAQPLPQTKDILPKVVELISPAAVAASGGPHSPRYASIALGKNEYVYSLSDRTFIRMIKDRYELPPWQVCGDWASVRISLMGESMEAAAPEFIWFFAYRDGQWQQVIRDTSGEFSLNGRAAAIPPYAVRCFNLDHRDLTD